MSKYIVWVSFCIIVEAADEDEAGETAIDIISDDIAVASEINVTSVREGEQEGDE